MPGYKNAILLFFVLYSCASFSQINTDELISKYSSPLANVSDLHSYFIIKIRSNPPAKEKKRIQFLASRILTENLLIMSGKDLQEIKDLEEFITVNIPANDNWKLSKQVADIISFHKNDTTKFKFILQANSIDFLPAFFLKNPEWKERISGISSGKFFLLNASFIELNNFFVKEPQVISIDKINVSPNEELGTPGFDLSANKINLAQAKYPMMDGRGMHVSIKEQFYDTTDIDLKGRFDKSPFASSTLTNHANFIATIIAGAPNSIYYAKGVAPAANISSSSFDVIMPDDDSYYKQDSITVQNHSYGSAIDNNYGINAAAFDNSANTDTVLLHIFSSGNSGDSISATGKYAGIRGFANLTGNFKMAKNVMLVGAADSFGNVVSPSSRGPAYDGRVKPDIVAFQKNGTSESAALVSGSALMLQQYYLKKNNSVLPSALARAILINSADDVNVPGPDFTSGFGNLNTFKALKIIEEDKIFKGSISQDSLQSFSINIPAGISQLKITLTWNDPAALAFSPTSLVNDVDLSLQSMFAGQIWKPWILNHFPSVDSLNMPAIRGRDSLNNVEQVTIENPAMGNYLINISGYNIATPSQPYYITYSFDTDNNFNWQFPVATDFLQTGQATTLRWSSNITGKGVIDYKLVSSSNWQTITDTANLLSAYLHWVAPDIISQVQLRMKINNTYFYSDTFSITTLLNPQIGFVCGDSILVYWQKLQNIQSYRLYNLGDEYMQPFKDVPDTFAVLSKNNFLGNYLAVAPVKNSKAEQKSYALNYTLQGAACYINSFIVEVNNNIAKLTLIPGTVYRADSIVFEKIGLSGNIIIYSAPALNVLPYVYDYLPLNKGISTFRAKIILKDGTIIYSQPQSVFYALPGEFMLFPVPVIRGTDIMINTPLPDGQIISVFNEDGKLMLQKEIQSASEHLPTSLFAKGLYFYRITKGSNKIKSGKILVL